MVRNARRTEQKRRPPETSPSERRSIHEFSCSLAATKEPAMRPQAATLTLAVADGVALLPPEVELDAKLGRYCCKSLCSDEYACCADVRFPDCRSCPNEVKSCYSVLLGELASPPP
jgi:hypothetical protein